MNNHVSQAINYTLAFGSNNSPEVAQFEQSIFGHLRSHFNSEVSPLVRSVSRGTYLTEEQLSKKADELFLDKDLNVLFGDLLSYTSGKAYRFKNVFVTLFLIPDLNDEDEDIDEVTPENTIRRNTVDAYYATENLQQYHKVLDILELVMPKVEEVEDSRYVYFTEYVRNVKGEIEEIGTAHRTDRLPPLYDEMYPFLNAEKLANYFFESNENILFLLGEPGTGKTSLIKRILVSISHREDFRRAVNSVYVKDPTVLKDYYFWAKLRDSSSNEKIDFLILDDLDKELSRRQADQHDRHDNNSDIVSSMLSFTNGVFPNPIKIIITSNILNENIDPALVRPGRCFDILQLRQLTREEARFVWNDVFKQDTASFNEIFGGAEKISQAQLMTEYEKIASRMTDYLIDESISMREKCKPSTASKIGFINR